MRLLALPCYAGEIEDQGVDFELEDEFALLVDQLLLELALVRVEELLRAHEEAARVLRTEHGV